MGSPTNNNRSTVMDISATHAPGQWEHQHFFHARSSGMCASDFVHGKAGWSENSMVANQGVGSDRAMFQAIATHAEPRPTSGKYEHLVLVDPCACDQVSLSNMHNRVLDVGLTTPSLWSCLASLAYMNNLHVLLKDSRIKNLVLLHQPLGVGVDRSVLSLQYRHFGSYELERKTVGPYIYNRDTAFVARNPTVEKKGLATP